MKALDLMLVLRNPDEEVRAQARTELVELRTLFVGMAFRQHVREHQSVLFKDCPNITCQMATEIEAIGKKQEE